MIIIVLGVATCAFLGIVLGTYFGVMVGVIAGIVILLVTAILSVLPLEGYEKKEESVIKLIELHRDGKYYIEKNEDFVTYAYDNRQKYSLDGKAYEEESVYGKIKIYESTECKTPILKKFITRPKRDSYTFSSIFTKIEYVFYVPVGSVIESGFFSKNV